MRSFLLRPALALTLALAFSACDNADPDPPPPPPPATTGTLTGAISLPPGAGGSVGNTRIALFADQNDYFTDSFAYQTAAGGAGEYNLAGIVPGTYYMDAWKDNNSNGAFDSDDFYGVYGTITSGNVNLTPISIAAGQTVTVSFIITRLPAPLAPKAEVAKA